jgi:outer membrane protein assembly factor BamB
LLVAICLTSFAAPVAADKDATRRDAKSNWPQWRGPLGTGVAPDAKPLLQWSETKNVRWKTSLPGLGHSTPIVWKNRIYLTTAVPYGEKVKAKPDTAPGAHDNSPVTQHHEFVALAVDRATGKIVWKKTLHKELPHEGGHVSGSLASASPATDGERVYAFFGSRGLYCLDTNGKLLWKKDLGRMQSKHAHGEGSSPVLHGETIVINWDHEGQSFVVAYDKRTGKERWKVKRDEVTSWASPIAIEQDGRALVIVSGTTRIRAYDLKDGKVIWQCGGMSANVVASPVAGDGMLYVASSYEKQALLAIRLAGAKGDITGSDHVVWKRTRLTPYVPSPLLYGKTLYFLRHYHGILSRVEAKTGKEPTGPFRLDGVREIYASPVAADGRVYVSDRSGATLVFSHGDIPRPLALNRLDDRFSASAALVGSELFLRGEKHLYCIAEKE